MGKTTTDAQESKVIVVAGRAEDLSNFSDLVDHYLFDNFTLAIAQPLEEDEGIDGKIRFIGFIVGAEVAGLTMDNQAARINTSGGTIGATVYGSMQHALDDAKERFGFDIHSEAAEERVEAIKQIKERFTPFSVNEVESFNIFSALMEQGSLKMIRGIWKETDEPVCVLALINHDETGSEMKINPMTVLVTSPTFLENIELFFEALNQ